VEEPLLTRPEVSHTLFAILDMSENVKRIREILDEEEPDGQDAEEEA
jgi:hypothetical protein